MPDATIQRDVAAPADTVWAILSDFGNMSWVPGAQRVEVEGAGAGMRRHIHGSGDGPPVVERLITIDDGAKTLTYTIDENNPLPVTTYSGEVNVADSASGSTLTWTAHFEPAGDPAEAAGIVDLMLGALTGWVAEAAEARA